MIVAFAAVLFLLSGNASYAQLQTGNLYGSVVNERGDAMAGVAVTVSGNGTSQAQLTNDQGLFRFLGLAPGSYQINAAKTGFPRVDHPSVAIIVGRNTNLELTLSNLDPLIGTWKLNLAKSTFAPGPAPRSSTLTYQGAGATLTATTEAVDPAGKTTKVVFMRIYDGQPHPTTGSPDYDASAYTRVDANNYIISRTKAGRLVEVDTQVISQDGRTNTVTARGVNAAGQPANFVQVFEKQ